MDAVLVFDELDKVSDTQKGKDIVHVLMQLIDPANNTRFSETYLAGIMLDLSRVVFVFTWNDSALVDPVLLDRIRCLEVPDMSPVQKLAAVHGHMLPRLQKAHNLEHRITLDDGAEAKLHAAMTSSQGLRTAEKMLETAVMAASLRFLQDNGGCGSSVKVEPTASVFQLKSKDFDGYSSPNADAGRQHLSMYS
jgi:ATP-dependent Lon protease